MKLFQNYSPQMLRMAIEIELQKAGSTVVAAKIALKRLEEDPEYYTKMQKALGEMRPGHKYIKRTPKSTGKGFNYFYNQAEYDQFRQQQQSGWLSKIAEFFGFKDTAQAMQKIDADYKSHDIAKKYNLTWDGWKDHVSEYFSHKDKWDNAFSGKKERNPADKKKERKPVAGKGEKKEGKAGKNLQLNVMRELYNIYGKKETPDVKKETPAIETLPAAVDESFSDFVDKLKGKENIEPIGETPEQSIKKIDIEAAKRSPKPFEPGGWVEGSGVQRGEFQNPDIYDKLNHMSPKIIENLFEYKNLDPTTDLADNLRNFSEITDKELNSLVEKSLKSADIKISKMINAVVPETRIETEREMLGIPEPPDEDIKTPSVAFFPKETEFVIPFLRADNTKFKAKDYTDVIPKDIYLVSDKNILTEKRPAYIPEIDESYFKYNHNLLPIYKMSEDKYVVQIDKGIPVSTGTFSSSFDKRNSYVVVNRDVLASMHDYYLKKLKATQKKEIEESGLKRKTKRISMIPEKKMSYAQMDFIENFIGKSEKAGETRKKVWEHYNIIRQDLKQKTEDMEIQIEEYYNTHAKGRETAYGDKGLKDNLLNDYGVKVKRQNGAEINDAEIDSIKTALDDIYQIFGNRSEMSKNFGLKISHSGEVLQHARKASGLFSPAMKAIGVTAKYGQKGTGFILAHEFGHFMDYYVGQQSDRHYFSDNPDSEAGQIAAVFRKNMSKVQTSKYQTRTCECFARAMEQYWAIKTNNKDVMSEWDKGNHPTEEIFKEKLMHLIDKFFENNDKMLKAFYEDVQFMPTFENPDNDDRKSMLVRIGGKIQKIIKRKNLEPIVKAVEPEPEIENIPEAIPAPEKNQLTKATIDSKKEALMKENEELKTLLKASRESKVEKVEHKIIKKTVTVKRDDIGRIASADVIEEVVNE
jgi:hypothetical protein